MNSMYKINWKTKKVPKNVEKKAFEKKMYKNAYSWRFLGNFIPKLKIKPCP